MFSTLCKTYEMILLDRLEKYVVQLNVVKASKLVCTNEAHNIKIKIRLGGISKIFSFCPHANMAASDKGIALKKKFLKKFLLNVTN